MEVQSQFIEMFKNLPVNGVIKDLTVGNIASVKKSYSKEDIINYIDISSIDNTTKTIVETSEHLVTKAPSRAQQCVQKGDILVSTVRPINRNIAVIEKDTSHLVASTGFCILRPQEGYKEYLLSIVLSDTYTEKMYDKANGGLYPAVNNSDVLNYGIHIPDEDTAKKVSALYQQSDKSKFVGFKSQFIEMFGSVDDNPKSYDIKKVGDFAECFAGATPSTKISSYWDNGNIPWMSSGEVHKARVQDTDAKITQQGYDGCSTKMVPIHSIVIALAGQGKTRGTVAINDIELCTNQSLCAIVPNEEVYYEYLFHNLRGRYKELRSMSGDVDGRGGLNLKHIQSIKVIVPPMSEQMKFVSIARQSDKSKLLHRTSIKYSKYSL